MPTPLGDIMQMIPRNYKHAQYAYTGTGKLEYFAGTQHVGAADDQAVWTIQKFIYDGSDNLIKHYILENIAWDDRTTAFP